MSHPGDPTGPRPRAFAQARAQAEIDARRQRARAARTVAGQAVDDDDRTELLSMLGLDDTPQPQPPHGTAHRADPEAVSLLELERELASYVHSVAAHLAVPADATGYEVSDTITAYLGLPDRRAECRDRELMLVWNDRDGWLVAAETRPTEPPWVIGYLGGHDILPHPRTVAEFVIDLRGGRRQPSWAHPIHPPHSPRRLAVLLRRHRTPHPGPAITSRYLGQLP